MGLGQGGRIFGISAEASGAASAAVWLLRRDPRGKNRVWFSPLPFFPFLPLAFFSPVFFFLIRSAPAFALPSSGLF